MDFVKTMLLEVYWPALIMGWPILMLIALDVWDKR